MAKEWRDVRTAIKKRGDIQKRRPQPVEEIFPEASSPDFLADISIRGRHDLQIHSDPLFPAGAEELSVLEHSQELCLERKGKGSHLVEKERPSVGQLEVTLLSSRGPSECAFLVSEEFTLREGVHDRSTIDGEEGMSRARPPAVNGARKQFLSRSCRPLQNDSQSGPADLARPRDERLHDDAFRDDAFKRHCGGRFHAILAPWFHDSFDPLSMPGLQSLSPMKTPMNSACHLLLGAAILSELASCQSFDKDATLLKADMRFEEGDFRAAILEYDRVLRHDPENLRALNNIGVARLRTGDPKGAIADLDTAVALQPGFAEALCNRGLARFQLGDMDGAIADYNAAVGLNSRYAKAWAARGIARGRKGDSEGAAGDFRTALNVAPTDWPDRKAVEAELAKLQTPAGEK
jgi:hypothetical protein